MIVIALNVLRWVLRVAIPIAILGGAGWFSYWMIANQPEPRRFAQEQEPLEVEAAELQRGSYRVTVKSQGTVQARTRSTLIPQVSGQVVEVADDFREGGFFEKGDVLVQIDPSDYETALTLAKAELAQARLELEQAEAQAEQARREWERLGDGQTPSPLTLHKPQLAEARARVEAAKASVAEAQRNLERTKIKAPYAGRVLSKSVDVGNYVSPGTELAQVYAVDYAEIRLPLTNEQISYVDLPELYRGQETEDRPEGPPVELTATVGGEQYTWQGRIVRTEGSVDTQSRQLFAVAQVDDPYGQHVSGRPPLKVGMFVEARIRGKQLQDVVVVPRRTLRQGSEVLLVNGENKLVRQRVDIVWRDEENVVVRDGLESGQRLCLTPVTYAAAGAPVEATLVEGGIREATAEPADEVEVEAAEAEAGAEAQVDTRAEQRGES